MAWGPLEARNLRAMARGRYPESRFISTAPDAPLVDTDKPKLARFPWKWRLLAAGMLFLGVLNTYLSQHSPNPAPRSVNANVSTQVVATPSAH